MKQKIKKIVSDAVAKLPSNKVILLVIVSLIIAVILYSVFLIIGSR